jgi:hypothetical protein
MMAEATERTELEALRTLVTARNARAKRDIRMCPAQHAQLRLMPDVRCGTQTLAQAARRV